MHFVWILFKYAYQRFHQELWDAQYKNLFTYGWDGLKNLDYIDHIILEDTLLLQSRSLRINVSYLFCPKAHNGVYQKDFNAGVESIEILE